MLVMECLGHALAKVMPPHPNPTLRYLNVLIPVHARCPYPIILLPWYCSISTFISIILLDTLLLCQKEVMSEAGTFMSSLILQLYPSQQYWLRLSYAKYRMHEYFIYPL